LGGASGIRQQKNRECYAFEWFQWRWVLVLCSENLVSRDLF